MNLSDFETLCSAKLLNGDIRNRWRKLLNESDVQAVLGELVRAYTARGMTLIKLPFATDEGRMEAIRLQGDIAGMATAFDILISAALPEAVPEERRDEQPT